MKRIILCCLVVFCFVGATFAGDVLQGWEKSFSTDAFGDSTSEAYLSYIGTGTFSNSATSDSELVWGIRVDADSVVFLLWEYGSYPVNGTRDDKYTITIRDDNKKDYTFLAYAGGSGIWVLNRDSLELVKILATNKAPRINIKENAKYRVSSSYKLGIVNTTNFTELYEEVFGKNFGTLSTETATENTETDISLSNKVVLKAPAGTQVGDILLMGRIPASGTEHAGEEIAWRVLSINKAKSGRKLALVLSEKVLTEMQSTTSDNYTPYTYKWSNCDINTYLNGAFLTDYGLSDVSMVSVKHATEAGTSSQSAETTSEKVFLLSKTEANSYLANDTARIAYNLSEEATYWWLRSPGSLFSYYVAYVSDDGSVIAFGDIVFGSIGVRPAFWILMED